MVCCDAIPTAQPLNPCNVLPLSHLVVRPVYRFGPGVGGRGLLQGTALVGKGLGIKGQQKDANCQQLRIIGLSIVNEYCHCWFKIGLSGWVYSTVFGKPQAFGLATPPVGSLFVDVFQTVRETVWSRSDGQTRCSQPSSAARALASLVCWLMFLSSVDSVS